MKHTQACPTCSGTGFARGEDGIDDICPQCNGKGSITFTSRDRVFESSFMKIVLFGVIFLIVFYSLFAVSITIFSLNFTLEIIILFIGHAALATILISYLMIKSLAGDKSTA